MKESFATAWLLTSLFLPVGTQSIAAAQAAPGQPGAGGQTNAAAATTADTATNKVDIAELMKGSSFTNSTGMVMVKVSPSLWAGKYDVTQEEYQKVMGSNPSQFKGDRNPVDSVSWTDAKAFCAKLNEVERKEEMLPEGMTYTLPTQSQWETLLDSASLDDAVNSMASRRSGPAAVGSLKPNSLGLYDTRGNMWQWCLDPDDKPFRVLRGGAWDTFVEINMRPEFRWYSDGPDDRKNVFSFRCVLVTGGG